MVFKAPRFIPAFVFALISTVSVMGNGPGNRPASITEPPATQSYIRFAENKGQWQAPIRYKADIAGGKVWLEDHSVTYGFSDMRGLHDRVMPLPARERENQIIHCHALKLDFPGSNEHPAISATGKYPDYNNYFIGKDPSKWASNVGLFAEVKYDNLFAGVDMVFRGLESTFKYDLIVDAGADASVIQMQWRGQENIWLDAEGRLNIKTSINDIVEQAPYAYQEVNGEKKAVACSFVLKDGRVTFAFPQGYDKSLPLVIDPVVVFSTYISSTADTYGFSATYDNLGNLIGGGIPFDVAYPTSPGAFDVTFAGSNDMGVTKLNPGGTALVWSTYIGGTGSDYPMSMISTPTGELYVYGSSSSADYPTTAGAFQTVFGSAGGVFTQDIVVTQINTTGTALIGSTYVGGTDDDGSNALYHNYGDQHRGEIMLDAAGNVYVASNSSSADFPVTAGAYQTVNGGGQDGVVFKLNPLLTSMLFSTYLGGAGDDASYGIRVNAANEPYVCGGTESAAFPTTAGSYQTAFGGVRDGFIVHFNTTGSTLLQSTFYGTADYDQTFLMDMDPTDNVYVYGQTEGFITPTPGTAGTVGGGMFIAQFNNTLSTRNYSCTFGSAGTTDISPIAFLVDVCGYIYISGFGNTTGLPVTADALIPTTDGSDFYLAVFTPGCVTLDFATYWGDPFDWDHVDGGTSRFDKNLMIYHATCAGGTDFPIFPTPGAYGPTNPSFAWNLATFKIQFDATGLAAEFLAVAIDSCAPYPVTFTNLTVGGDMFYWDFGDGVTLLDTISTINYYYPDPGTYVVTMIAYDSSSCSGVDTIQHTITVYENPIVAVSGDVGGCGGTPVNLLASGGDFYEWSPGAGMFPSNTVPNPTVTVWDTTTFQVIVTSAVGCVDTGYVTVTVNNPVVEAGPPVFFCEGSGGAQLTAGPISGSGFFYYEWWCDSSATYCALDSVFDNDPIANPDVTTMYYVQITDSSGCMSQIDSVLVTVLPNPIVDAGPDQWICPFPAPGANLNATVSGAPGPYVYSWDPPTGLSSTIIPNPYARPDTTTIYVLTVVSSNGCTSIPTTVDTLSSVTVHVFPQPIADAGPDRDLCEGDTLMLLGLGYGAGPTYTYEWSPFTPPTTISANNIPNPLAFPDITTDYTLVVWSNGCPSIADTVTVNAHTNPTADAGPDRDICRFDSVLIDAQAGGDSSSTFYLFEWSPAAGLSDAFAEDPMASPDTTNLYYVIGISSWGCESPRDSVLVTVKPTPIPDAGPPIQICYGDSVLIPTSIYYDGTPPAPASAIWPAWVPAVQINDTTLLQPTVWPTSSGFYYVTLQYNTCFTTDSVLLTVIPSPVANVSADTTILCEGQSTQLSATGGLGGADFLWSPATGLSDPNIWNPVATPDTTTTYTVTAAEGGCEGVNTITIQVIPLPEMGYFSSQPTGCAPLTVSFLEDVKDALFYSWNFGDGTVSNEPAPVHTFMLPGDYTVTLTASNLGACESSISTITVHVSDPSTAEFTADPGFPVQLALPDTRVQFTDRSSYAVSWLWDFGDGQSSYDQHPAHSWTQPGEYTVTLTTQNEDGCISVVEHGPFVVKTPEVFIPNVFTPGDGVNDVFIVSYTGDQPFVMTVFDRWGVKMYEGRNKTEGWDGRDLKGSTVPTGVYYYAVKIGDREFAGEVTLLR